MLLTNHTLTGALIALTVNNPVLAAPLATASHFALDSLPHFGIRGMSFKERRGFMIGFADASVSLAMYITLIALMPQNFVLITAGMFFAALPDLFYIPDILWGKRYDPKVVQRFHHWIQWGERPWGLFVEAVWLPSMLYFIFNR